MEQNSPKTKRQKEQESQTKITKADVLRDKDASPEANVGDVEPWFKYLRAGLKIESAKFSLATLEDTLFPNEKEMRKAEKNQSNKRNFFVKENTTGQLFMVKATTETVKGAIEFAINSKLGAFPQIITPLFKFVGKLDIKGDQLHWIVYPYVPSFNLKLLTTCDGIIKLKDGRTFNISETEFLQGLCDILSFFSETDPTNMENEDARFTGAEPLKEIRVKYFHGDLNETQIIYNPIEKKWFLVDFGNSRLSFQKINPDYLVPETSIIQATAKSTTSTYDVQGETKKLIVSFLPMLPSHKDLLLSLIKNHARRQTIVPILEKLLETEKAKHTSAEKEPNNLMKNEN